VFRVCFKSAILRQYETHVFSSFRSKHHPTLEIFVYCEHNAPTDHPVRVR
jgi:hypothetical protein